MAEIEKIAVYDPRIIQEPARYAVQQGALSVSTAQFQATSATTSNLSFQVLVPSLNVFIDRKIELNTAVTVYAEAVPSQAITSYKGSNGSTIVTVLQVDPSGVNLTKPEQAPFVSVQSTPAVLGSYSQNTAVVLPEGSYPGQSFAGVTSAFAPVPSTDGGSPIKCGLASYMPIGLPQDLYLSMFPVQTLVNSMTVTVNDCSISLTGDTLKEQLLLAQTRDSIQQRTCPSKFDIYAYPRDDALAANGNGQSYGQARDSDIPNGSWPIVFVNPNDGTPLPRFGSYPFPGNANKRVPVINWRPCFIPAYSSLQESVDLSTQTLYGCTDVSSPLPIMFRYQSVEPLAISPFLWQDSKQMSEVGLYGITNMTISMNLNNAGAAQAYSSGTIPSAQATTLAGGLTNASVSYYDNLANTLNSYSYMTKQGGIFSLLGNMKLLPPIGTTSTSTGPWVNPRVFCTFLTPPPNTPLPLVSCVPYVEFPRYTSSMLGDFGTPGRVQVYTNTVTLSSIPDVLVVFAKAAYRGQTQADSYIPISGVSVNFDNYSNLCSNYTQEDLYACSVAAGLDMDFSQFRGYARSNIGTVIPQYSAGTTFFDTKTTPSPLVQLTGSPVLLRMGQDIPLSSGLAPGTLGNYSVQVTLTLDNTNGFYSWLSQIPQASQNVSITIMGVNSGFFESCKGSSAIRKTILNTVDVESVSASTSVTATQLQRLVGGSGMRTSAGLTHSLAVPKFSPASSESGEPRRKYGRTLGSMIS